MERSKTCLWCRRPWPWSSLPWASPHRTAITEPAPAAAAAARRHGNKIRLLHRDRGLEGPATSRDQPGGVKIWSGSHNPVGHEKWFLELRRKFIEMATFWILTRLYYDYLSTTVNNKGCICCSTLIPPVLWDAEPMTFVWCWPLSQKWDKHNKHILIFVCHMLWINL